jgi:thiol:disulfide interchange protein
MISTLCALPASALAKDSTTDPKASAFYSVETYNPQADPEEDLVLTIKRAKAEGKHILLQVGGDWCSWCRTLSAYYHSNKAVGKVLSEHYVVMKVNVSKDNMNEKFMEKLPKTRGYPHLYVLDSDGKLLHSQPTTPLEESGSYSEEAMLAFLNKWIPGSPAASAANTTSETKEDTP